MYYVSHNVFEIFTGRHILGTNIAAKVIIRCIIYLKLFISQLFKKYTLEYTQLIEPYLEFFLRRAYLKPPSSKGAQRYASHSKTSRLYLPIISKTIPSCLNIDFYLWSTTIHLETPSPHR